MPIRNLVNNFIKGIIPYIYGTPAGINNGTPVPWDNPPSDTRTATRMLGTALNASDTYELILRTGSQAASDSETESIQLSGLEAVPEPSTLALIGLASVVLAMAHRCIAAA